MKKLLCFIISNLFFLSLFSQQKVLDHTVYNDWKSLKHAQVSDRGSFSAYEIQPHRGDGTLFLHNAVSNEKKQFARGYRARISHKEDVLLFSIHPGYDTLRTLKLEKVDHELHVKDSLGIYFLNNDSLVKHPNLINFKVPEKNNVFAYTLLADSLHKEKKKEKKRCWLFNRNKKDKEENAVQSDGNTLFVQFTDKAERMRIQHVKDFWFDPSGQSMVYVTHKKLDKKDSLKVHRINLETKNILTSTKYYSAVAKSSFSEKNGDFAFVASRDSSENHKSYDLYVWGEGESQPQLKIHSNRGDLDTNMHVSPHAAVKFSNDNKKLFVGITEKREEEPEDTLLSKEKAVLDVWHYKNNRLQPQQLKEKKQDKRDSYLTVLHRKENRLVQLENDTLSARMLDNGNSHYALGYSNEQYVRTYNWTYPWPRDFYRINVNSGEPERLGKRINYMEELSPDGRYFVYFLSDTNNYFFYDTQTEETGCITCYEKDSIVWKSDNNGMPFKAGPVGTIGFTSPQELLIHSKHDVWKFNFGGRELKSITNRQGMLTNTKLRLKRWSNDSTYIDLDSVYLHGVNQTSYDESIHHIEDSRKGPVIVLMYQTDHKLINIRKAKNADHVIFQQMNVKDYPDLYTTKTSFENPQKISNTNPQQSEYIWPEVEQVSWKTYDGEKRKGLLYKPENFDSTKSYPMLVYFYEMLSHRKHYHYIPKPTASIIYPTEYTSAGYVVFIPNIRYEPGHPAEGAYNSIMSGTDHVLNLYPNIDSTRLGLQGQSWGGYQTAQLITMTDRYSAAMAGAPVSNMFSAYGGIRWGSGLNRAFQYERTQSRIGKTIWEAPELYIENSPLFGVPEIETPLLIMHNDGDGAVPWYQGIELFTAMKRLNKPVWMLNYNGDQHNLMKNANRVDLSIRMRQFFDHFLQNEPAPEWLKVGVPAVEKGENYGLEEYEED
ncbi:MAG: prolyl oligopeptidase family serine peptidase [Bacteroidota bacterium]